MENKRKREKMLALSQKKGATKERKGHLPTGFQTAEGRTRGRGKRPFP